MNNEPVAWIGKNELQFGFTETTVTSEKESWDDIPLYTHPAKEHFEDEPQAEELHEILQNNTHPAKELHLSLQKSKETGELLAVTYTDDEHRIVEVLWQKPPAKTLTDDDIADLIKATNDEIGMINIRTFDFVKVLLRKAQEK